MNTWRAIVRLAWRDARASKSRFLFVVLAVAVGVGALTGVRAFSRSFRATLLKEARTLMAADMSVRIFGSATPRQEAVLERLARRGVRRTQVTETLTMASSPQTPDPLLISIKAVDPALYPFYGTVKLAPRVALREALNADTVVVSDDLLLRLRTRVGDSLRLGGQEFRIAGVLVSEPDRMTGSLNVGPRVMLTRQGLDRTGLITLGSRASERYLLELPPGGPGVAEVRLLLKRAFPEGLIADYRQTHPVITRGLNRATTFLSLVSLIALLVGALGVATAMHAHLQQKLDQIAVLKCLGARSSQVIRIYVVQTLLLALAGAAMGLLVGVAVEAAFPLLISRYFQMHTALGWDPRPAVEGLGAGLLITLLFTLPPLLGIRHMKPALIFRREMAEASPRRWRLPRASDAAPLALVLGFGLIAVLLTRGLARESFRIGAYFAGAVTVTLVVMSAVAWLLLRSIRAFLATTRRRLHPVLRTGLANLYRPGNHAGAILVALGVGVTFTLLVFLIQRSLLAQLMSSAPPGMPNVFLLDIPGGERAPLADLVARQPGVAAKPEIMASVAARLTAIDGQPLNPLSLRDWGRRFLRTRSVTWAAAKPRETEILSGAWWSADSHDGAQVCVGEEAARILNLKPGARLSWNIAGRPLESRVACIERTESIRMAARFEFLFSPGSLDGYPAVYYGSVRARPADVPSLQRVVYERYPTVTVINVADVLAIVQQVVDQIALVVRFLSAFAILAGVIVLSSSVAGTRFRRIREVVILKTLGATRLRVAGVFSVEFAVLGAAAGLIGSILATAISSVMLKRLLSAEFHFDPLPNAAAVVLSAFLAVAAGWAASYRILGQRPLEVLREE